MVVNSVKKSCLWLSAILVTQYYGSQVYYLLQPIQVLYDIWRLWKIVVTKSDTFLCALLCRWCFSGSGAVCSVDISDPRSSPACHSAQETPLEVSINHRICFHSQVVIIRYTIMSVFSHQSGLTMQHSAYLCNCEYYLVAYYVYMK